RAEEALRQSHQRLEETLHELRATQEQVIQQERLSALGEMASGVAHDLNNTLTPVVGYSDVLVNGPRLPGDVQERLELIRTGALDAARVVARLREFYRPSNPADKHETLRLAALLREVVELTRPKWRDGPQREGRNIEVDLQLEDVPPVRGAGVEIREVLTNLVFNAVDALPNGGKITLRLRAESGCVLIEVADVGVGMPADVQAKCLEPFFTTKGNRGTGLGLSVCHGIVQRHGGRIRVESSPGNGTTISVSLPAAEDGRSVEEAPSDGSLPASRVLYIDDDPDVRASVRFMLETLGQEVDVAESGRRGLEMLAAGDYDLVITDLGMPEMDGNAVTREIKATQPDLPVVMITGWGATATPESSKSGQRPDQTLGKPPTSEQLREVLVKVLRP
ncbi:MAG: response regulator, partial [Planctomycetes bacterium]|nr:response regulator [Planctomycetota bacterium]